MNCLFVSLAHVLTGLFDLLFSCFNSLYILNSNSPVDEQLGKMASCSVGHLYTCLLPCALYPENSGPYAKVLVCVGIWNGFSFFLYVVNEAWASGGGEDISPLHLPHQSHLTCSSWHVLALILILEDTASNVVYLAPRFSTHCDLPSVSLLSL